MRVVAGDHVPKFGRQITDIPVNSGLPSPEEIQDELLHYCNVLLGREIPEVKPGFSSPYLELQEIASAYFARASELDILIHWEEQEGNVMKGHPYYRLRTGQIRTFIDMAKRMADLGSRRLSQETLLHQQRYDEGS